MAAAFGPPPRFLVPSLVWYGLSPRLNGVGRAAGVPELAPGGWGGMIASEEDVGHVIWTLDSALLLLNLAGYQVSEVAIGVPAVAAETAAADLVAVDLLTMGIRGARRGSGHPWPRRRRPRRSRFGWSRAMRGLQRWRPARRCRWRR